MLRDLRRLADTRFDVAILGAGFYGAITAWDATLRGLSVALIDKSDFGAATSFNNLKTLHGGLRSLQSLDVRQMRLFIRERRALARIAPHLVRPMAFIVPTSRHPARSAAAMRIALAINDVVSHDRHDGLTDPGLRLPAGRVVSRDECLRLNPVIDPNGVTGGAIWHDYQMHNADRMTLSFVISAAARGAAVANYVEATALVRDGDRVVGVRARDGLDGDCFDVRADLVVNATGPWAARWLERCRASRRLPAPRLSRAMNVITRRVDVPQGCGGRAAGRFLFLVPWRDVTLVGTSHDDYQGGPDALTVTRADLDAFLGEIREAFPRAALGAADIRLVHRGLLPMVSARDGRVTLLRESAVVDHAADGVEGLVSMFGVRYTTARHTAARCVDLVFRRRGVKHPPPCRTDRTPIHGGDIGVTDTFVSAVLAAAAGAESEALLRRLALTYGTRHGEVLRIVREDPGLATPLGRTCAVSGAEIVHAVRHEAAVRLADALIRRTEAGSAGHPGTDAVDRAATLAARELAWTEQRLRSERADVEAFYRLPA